MAPLPKPRKCPPRRPRSRSAVGATAETPEVPAPETPEPVRVGATAETPEVPAPETPEPVRVGATAETPEVPAPETPEPVRVGATAETPEVPAPETPEPVRVGATAERPEASASGKVRAIHGARAAITGRLDDVIATLRAVPVRSATAAPRNVTLNAPITIEGHGDIDERMERVLAEFAARLRQVAAEVLQDAESDEAIG